MIIGILHSIRKGMMIMLQKINNVLGICAKNSKQKI